MKKTSHWRKPIGLFGVMVSTVVSLNAPSTALTSLPTDNTTESPSTIQLAQGLVGQCRAAKQRIFVYTERSATSQTVRTIGLDEEVTLADSGSAGWIAISSPATGYVQARDLKPCKGGNQPDSGSGAGVCRKVTVAQGLTIRQSASPSAALVGGVLSGNTVKLTNPKQSQKDSQGRTWIQITAPKAGWISSGFPDGNLGPEFSCP
ncbi:MAG TPA: hypothetical protein DD379_20625 [Cyanobacteria bacterium UBA11162]|nr:hypothetical protein [Cyanobacteria bacterium UBA11162]